MLDHEKEIFSRPARTWFQTSKEKEKATGELRRVGTRLFRAYDANLFRIKQKEL